MRKNLFKFSSAGQSLNGAPSTLALQWLWHKLCYSNCRHERTQNNLKLQTESIMTSDAIIDLIVHYDEAVNAGMSVADQVDFLTSNYKLLGETCGIYRDPINRNVITNFRPLQFLFASTSHIWALYDPGVLKTLPYDRQVILAQIGSHHYETRFVYTKIVNSTTLPLKTRALFCAARMDGSVWTEQPKFFENYYRFLCLGKQLHGEPEPDYPTTFSPRHFYRNLSPYYESHLPQKLAEAINSDNVAQFSIALALCNRQLSKNLILHLLRQQAINILTANLTAIDKFLSFEKTILFCASSVHEPVATSLLSAIESAAPDSIRNASDIFGNNALWYLFYREGSNRFSAPKQEKSIETLLIDAGCDPHHLNCIGLDYAATAAARQQLQRVDMC